MTSISRVVSHAAGRCIKPSPCVTAKVKRFVMVKRQWDNEILISTPYIFLASAYSSLHTNVSFLSSSLRYLLVFTSSSTSLRLPLPRFRAGAGWHPYPYQQQGTRTQENQKSHLSIYLFSSTLYTQEYTLHAHATLDSKNSRAVFMSLPQLDLLYISAFCTASSLV